MFTSVYRVSNRFFSSSARLASYRLVEPAVVHEDVEAGRAVLVDLRATDDGINLPNAERIPFESLVAHGNAGGDAAAVDRDQLISQLSAEQLGAADYHAWGSSLLAAMEKTYGKKFTADQARQFFKEKAADVQSPKKFAQRAPAGGRPASQFADQATPTQAQFAGKKAAEFERMASYNPDISKTELAASLSDAELARRAGVAFQHLGQRPSDGKKDGAAGGDKSVQASFKLNRDQAQSVPRDRPVYLIDFCGVQSPLAAELLGSAGWSNVNVVDGGLDRWLMNGCDVELSGPLAASLESQLAASVKNAPGGIQEIND